jgi:Gliding motility associated protein GldN
MGRAIWIFSAFLLFRSISSLAANTDSLIVCSVSDSSNADVSRYFSEEPYRLPWALIAEKDIAVKTRVWSLVTFCENPDMAVNNLAMVLKRGLLNGEFVGYEPKDDKFSTQLNQQELDAVKSADYRSVTKFKVKADWILNKADKKMFYRIIGVTPIVESRDETGNYGAAPAFWVYFSDCRNYLATQKISKKNRSGALNWDEFLVKLKNK